MRLFKAKFEGMWLSGYAVVLADSIDEAADLLVAKLEKERMLNNGVNIRQNLIENIQPISMEEKHAVIIWDGDY